VHQPNSPSSQQSASHAETADFWAEGTFAEPGWHRKASDESAYYPEHLIVLVHGAMSHWKDAWQNMPAYLFQRLEVDCDLYSYSYPSSYFEEACYETAAIQLYQKLTQPDFQSYRHISFITHSTGGLVVKRALLHNRAKLEQTIKTGDVDLLDRTNLIFRTRRIINFGVPHQGLSFGGWSLFTVLAPLAYPIWGLLHIKNKFTGLVESSKGYQLGYNRIFPQLTWWWRDLVRLEALYASFIQMLDQRGLPRPVSTDFIGGNDQAIALKYGDVEYASGDSKGVEGRRSDANAVIVRGTHCRAKEPDGPDDYRMDVIVSELRSLFDEGALSMVGRKAIRDQGLLDQLTARNALMIADRTLVHMASTEKTFDIINLIEDLQEPPGFSKDERRTVVGSWLGSQSQVLNYILPLCAQGQNGMFVVTGLAGLGKSSVLRRLATTLCVQHLANKAVTGLPLYMPIFRYGADADEQEVLRTSGLHWDSFARWWCEAANDENEHAARSDPHRWSNHNIQQAPSITAGWLNRHLQDSTAVVILDGVDDFLVRNASLGLGYDSIITLVQELRRINRKGACEVVLGIRSSLAMPEYLRLGCVTEIAVLSSEQAENLVYTLRDQTLSWERLLTRVFRRVCRHYFDGTEVERKQIELRLCEAELVWNATRNDPFSKSALVFLAEIATREDWQQAWTSDGFGLTTYLASQPPEQRIKEILEALDRDLVGFSVRSLLDRTADPRARKLVLTPLILAKLVRADRFDELETPSQIFGATLRICIEENKLPELGPSTDQWLDMLTLIGHLFFVNFWPDCSFDLIARKSSDLYDQWAAHLKSQPFNSGLVQLLSGFALVKNHELLNYGLKRTVFLAVHSFRFEHREWEDYLAARHLRYSIQFGFVEGMCDRGSLTRMHFLTSNMLPGDQGEFPIPLIDSVYERAQSLGLGQPGKDLAQIPVGNLLGVLGHSTMALRPATLDRLMDQYLGRPDGEVPPLVELVALNSIGFRLLRQCLDGSHSVQNARKLLVRLKCTYGFGDKLTGKPRNTLIAMVAWLLGKSLSIRLDESWNFKAPGTDTNEPERSTVPDAMAFAMLQGGQGPSSSLLDDTMQRIFVNLLPEILEEVAKCATSPSNLPPIVVEELKTLAMTEVTSGLASMLGNTPDADELYAAVLNYTTALGLPELACFWSQCRKVYGH